MFSDYEVVKEEDGSFSAVLAFNGMKAVNEMTEAEVYSRMSALDSAYENGFDAGVKDAKNRIKIMLGL